MILIIFILLIHDIYNPFFSYIGDEYAFFDLAKDIATKGLSHFSLLSANGVYGHSPILDSVYQAFFMKIFGVNIFSWKLANIIIVIISIILVYKIGVLLFSNQLVGLSSAIFFGFSHYLLSFAHIPYNNLHALIPFLISVLFFVYFHKTNSFLSIFFAGIFSGLSFYTFLTARLVLLLISPFLIINKNKVRNFILYISGFLITFIPFYLFNKSEVFYQMSRRYLADPNFKGLNFIGVRNFFLGLFFEKYISQNHYFTGPFITIILAIFLLIGTFYLFKNFQKHKFISGFLFYWFFVFQFIINIGNVNLEVPNTRLHVILPALCLIAGYGLVRIIKNRYLFYLILALYMIYQLIFFYIIIPKRYSLNNISLLLSFSKNYSNKNICPITDDHSNFSFDQINFMTNLYQMNLYVKPFNTPADLTYLITKKCKYVIITKENLHELEKFSNKTILKYSDISGNNYLDYFIIN